MKRFISILLLTALLSLSLFAAVSCGGKNGDKKCSHIDANDNSLCDKCSEPFEDGTDLPDEGECTHVDTDDNGLCDKCDEPFEDGCDNHVDKDDDLYCDVPGCGVYYDSGVNLPIIPIH